MENILRAFLIVILVGSFAGNGIAGDLFIDAEFKQFEDEYWPEFRACLKIKDVVASRECDNSLEKKVAADPRVRGRNAYFEKHYEILDFDTLENQLDELKVLHKKAPKFGFGEERPHGVLSRQIFGLEINLIERLQTERYRAIFCEEKKKEFQKINFGLENLPKACKQYFKEKEVEARLKQ